MGDKSSTEKRKAVAFPETEVAGTDKERTDFIAPFGTKTGSVWPRDARAPTFLVAASCDIRPAKLV